MKRVDKFQKLEQTPPRDLTVDDIKWLLKFSRALGDQIVQSNLFMVNTARKNPVVTDTMLETLVQKNRELLEGEA